MVKARGLAGSNKIKRDHIDFYPTPKWVTYALLKRENFNGTIWEPASGNGAISRILENQGFDVKSTEIRTDEDVYGEKGVNFLTIDCDKKVDNIITNPPFFLANEFLIQSKKFTKKKIAFFLKTVFLESINRYPLFLDKEFPLAKVYVFCRRVTLSKPGVNIKTGGTMSFAWFVWEHEWKDKPVIRWINDDKNNYRKKEELF